MEPVSMTVSAFNALPAHLRKTVNGIRFVFMGASGEWRAVIFTKA